jgi:hypothetical protein
MTHENEIDPNELTTRRAALARASGFELCENPAPAGLIVYAVIRASSKYAHQGRVGGRIVAMRVTRIEEREEYAFHLDNGNRYRREDLTFCARHENCFIKLR